jgi:hypothetical protein
MVRYAPVDGVGKATVTVEKEIAHVKVILKQTDDEKCDNVSRHPLK